MKQFFTIVCILFAGMMRAEDTRTITVSKADKLSIAIAGLAGADAKILQDDLQRSGFFSIVPASNAAFTASGSSGGAGLSGTVTDRAGKTVLSRTFDGSARGKVHAFADEIVETLTGHRGFANTPRPHRGALVPRDGCERADRHRLRPLEDSGGGRRRCYRGEHRRA